MRQYGLLILFGVLLTVFTACDGITKSIKDTLNNSSTATEEQENADDTQSETNSFTHPDDRSEKKKARGVANDFIHDTEALGKAEEALKNLPRFKGKKIRLYSDVHFYDDGRVMLSVQHPDNPEYIDAYEYDDGAWSEPKPVQISVRTNIESKLFDLDKITFKTVATIANNYDEKAKTIEGAKPANHVYGVIWGSNFVWYPRSIDGSRQRFAIDFNLDGSITMFRRE